MQPIDIAWQLLRKAAGIEGPVDPRRPGMSPGMNPQTGHIQQQDSLPPEAYEQVDRALAEEARLRGLPTDESGMPPPPGPKDNMRIMPPRTDEFGGLPPNMQDYVRQLSARRGRPPQGTSAQNPDDVLRSMSPIELAMDTLQKRTPRSYRGEAGYEQFAPHAMTAGADTPEDISQEEYQNMMDYISDEEAQDFRNPSDLRYPSDIPVEDPARHQQLDVGRQEALAEGVDMQQTRTPPADAIRRTRNDAEIPKNPFQEGYPYSSRIRPSEPPQQPSSSIPHVEGMASKFMEGLNPALRQALATIPKPPIEHAGYKSEPQGQGPRGPSL